MPKVKVARKSTFIDMAPMCDLGFLLLTFFILTSQFKGEEAIIVDTPSSIAEFKVPDMDVITITVSKTGVVYYCQAGKFIRRELIDRISDKFNLDLNEEQKDNFTRLAGVGVPVAELKRYLSMDLSEMQLPENNPGIPSDSLNNELQWWIAYGRISNVQASKQAQPARICIKGDQDVPYEYIKKVMNTLQDKNVNKFILVTDLEAKPKELFN